MSSQPTHDVGGKPNSQPTHEVGGSPDILNGEPYQDGRTLYAQDIIYNNTCQDNAQRTHKVGGEPRYS